MHPGVAVELAPGVKAQLKHADERGALVEVKVTEPPGMVALREELEELKAPSWLKGEVLKATREEDYYVLWVDSADGPGYHGTREQLLNWGVPASRLRRADERGTSIKPESRWDGHPFDCSGLVAEQLGWLPRHLVGEYAKLVQDPARLRLLNPFDDAPVAEVDDRKELKLGSLVVIPVSDVEDLKETGWLRQDQLLHVKYRGGQYRCVVRKLEEEKVALEFLGGLLPSQPA